MEKQPACVYLPLELLQNREVRASIESIVDCGYDLSLFTAEELEVMCQRQGYFLNIAENTKKHIHCMIFGEEFSDIQEYFENENFVSKL